MLFWMFDFTNRGKLSYEEIFLGIKSFIWAYYRLSYKKLPEPGRIEKNVKLTFSRADQNPENYIEFYELYDFIVNSDDIISVLNRFEPQHKV
jgi:hypothetical protein